MGCIWNLEKRGPSTLTMRAFFELGGLRKAGDTSISTIRGYLVAPSAAASRRLVLAVGPLGHFGQLLSTRTGMLFSSGEQGCCVSRLTARIAFPAVPSCHRLWNSSLRNQGVAVIISRSVDWTDGLFDIIIIIITSSGMSNRHRVPR